MKLDAAQKKAVLSNHKTILTLAGAGSGKTRVLTERVKRLLDDGVEPHNIVCITFTNMAAQEMLERLGDQAVIGDAFIGTIHAFANRVYALSGMEYELLTTEKELELMHEILQNEIKYRCLKIKRYLGFLDQQKLVDMGKASEESLSEYFFPSEVDDLKAAEADKALLCAERNIITFDELLQHTTNYFSEQGWSLEHLLVDEFQDVGDNEWNFIEGLNSENNFYVADDKQAIYGFKGGNVGIMLNLSKRPDVELIKLENNYRNRQAIVDMARRIATQITDRIKMDSKVINTDVPGTVVINVMATASQYIKTISEDKDNLRDWFILCRSNKQMYQLEEILDDLEVPTAIVRRAGMSLEDMKDLMEENTVKLMTVHMAKGLENKNVLLYGNFPVTTPAWFKNLDERKVMYVGITRAQENLIILN